MDAEERTHNEELLATFERRLRVLEQKAAATGYDVKPEVAMEIEDLGKKIIDLKARLGIPSDAPLSSAEPLVPQQPELPRAQVSFGQHNRYGDIRIGDVVGEDVTTVTDTLQAQLRALLPPALHDRIPALVRLLSESSAHTSDDIESLTTDAALRPVLQQLSGQQIRTGQSQITFGSANRFNTVTIGNIAGGNITTLNLAFKESTRTIRRLGWILAGIIVIVALTGIVLYQINGNNARRAEQARQTIAADTLINLTNLNARLDLVDQTLKDMPGQNGASSLRELIGTQQIASLRQALVSKPLTTNPDNAFLQQVTETDAQPEQIRRFYTNLGEVQDDTESLITTLGSLAQVKNGDTARGDQYLKQLDLERRILQNSSQITYIWGLITLNNLGVQSADIASRLDQLQHFEPRELQATPALLQTMAPLVDQLAQLVNERKALVEAAQTGLADALTIKPDDPWNVVVGKAIATRKTGDIERAVAAFQRYGEMFSATDPTAAHYAQVAQPFTQQVGTFGIESAMYIYEVDANSSAKQAGIQVGDIVVELGGAPTPNADAFEAAVRQIPQGQSISLVILRLQPDGSFARTTPKIGAAPLGINVMPI